MEKVFVDTGGWVALFVKNDKHHQRAVSIFDNLKTAKTPIYTSDYVIDETITTVLARGSHKQSVLAGEALLASRIIKIIYVAPEHLKAAWTLYKKYKDKEFSFTDVSCFAIMESYRIKKAFSFDREFIQAGIDIIK